MTERQIRQAYNRYKKRFADFNKGHTEPLVKPIPYELYKRTCLPEAEGEKA